MALTSRFILKFSMSVLERTEAAECIKEPKKHEFIKPYGTLYILKKAAFLVLASAGVINFLILALLILKPDFDIAFFERTRWVAIITVGLLLLFALLIQIQDFLYKRTMLHNDQAEKEDDDISVYLKINRFYIERIQKPGSIKAFWSYTKKAYRKNGFIFVQLMDNSCIVIPERIFISEDDIIKLYNYIKEQISKHKR